MNRSANCKLTILFSILTTKLLRKKKRETGLEVKRPIILKDKLRA
jgi:hypothetical protein